jgi:hypothetical protein
MRRFKTIAITSLAVVGAALLVVSCGGPPPEEEGFTEDLQNLMPEQGEAPMTFKLAPPGSIVLWGDQYAVAATLDLVPGDVIPEHQSEGAVLYAVTDATLATTWQGEEQEQELTAGDVRYLEPGTYSFTNSGAERAELLIVSRSDVELPETAAVEDPFGPIEDESGTVLLDGNVARVVRFDLPVEASVPLDPAVPLRVVYAESDGDLKLADRAEVTTPMTLKAGEADAKAGEAVTLANIGETPARVLVFEFAE